MSRSLFEGQHCLYAGVAQQRFSPAAQEARDAVMVLPGELYALMAAVFFAVAGVTVAKGSGQGAGDNGALLSIVMTVIAAALVWLPTASMARIPAAPEAAMAGVAWFALSGLLAVFLGRTLLFQSIAYLGAIRASTLFRLNPVFSVLLAALILGETIGGVAGAGMLLILVSFALLLRRSLASFLPGRVRQPGGADGEPASPWHYAYGPASALSYSLSNVVRKHALNIIPDSNLATFVSALAGLVSFALAALFVERYRAAFRGLIRNATRWQVAAGVFSSAGQLSQFAAIQHIEVSRAVMISSTEIFFSMFLAVYVLKTEPRPEPLTLLAAVMAMLGVVLVAAG
jgi:drug/metabolite transporter (DMT)-like permease